MTTTADPGVGARAVGSPEAPEVVDAMRRLGYDFGRLVYLLDAFEDYEKDWRQGEFNALRASEAGIRG